MESKEFLQKKLYRKAFILSVFIVSYNILEGIFSIIAGKSSDTVSLVSFGIDRYFSK